MKFDPPKKMFYASADGVDEMEVLRTWGSREVYVRFAGSSGTGWRSKARYYHETREAAVAAAVLQINTQVVYHEGRLEKLRALLAELKPAPRKPTSCGSCDYDEAEGELMNQCAKCKAADGVGS